MNSIEADTTANANILRNNFQERALNVSAPDAEVQGQSVIIVGAGAFGSSLALELVTHSNDKYLPR